MNSSFHVPVLSEEVLNFIISNKTGIYIDCTLGGGGHSKLILEKLSKSGRLIGIDQDMDAIKRAKKILDEFENVFFIHDNFKNLKTILRKLEFDNADGILLDLGVSSYQIDCPNRGFSYNVDTDLDMRMDQTGSVKAMDILNSYSREELARILFEYGQERKSRVIANLIVKEREKELFTSSAHLRKIIEDVVNPKYKIKSFSRIFQAIRIEVNKELENLKIVLQDSLDLLKTGGRLVVISYHSLEDRITKRFMKYWENPCDCPAELPVCQCGNLPRLKILTRKAIRAQKEEILNNNRARSAVLRAGEKI